MSAVEVLRLARAAGISVGIDGDNLVLEAALPPPPAVLDALSLHKPTVLALLRSMSGGWSAEDWHVYFDERAGIIEHDAGLSRAQSERRAFDDCIVRWLDRNPAPSAPGRCARCGRTETRDAVVLPFGTEPGTHVWLHAECWPAWHRARRDEAANALRARGIVTPVPARPSAGLGTWPSEQSGADE
jgi:hypothetical protein